MKEKVECYSPRRLYYSNKMNTGSASIQVPSPTLEELLALRRNFKECTKEIRMQKYLRKKLLPPHSMPCSNFSGRIYVKKTPEQCSFNHYNSQRAKEDT